MSTAAGTKGENCDYEQLSRFRMKNVVQDRFTEPGFSERWTEAAVYSINTVIINKNDPVNRFLLPQVKKQLGAGRGAA